MKMTPLYLLLKSFWRIHPSASSFPLGHLNIHPTDYLACSCATRFP